MNRYDFATVKGPYVAIEITDASELEHLISRIREFFPKMNGNPSRKLPTGEWFTCTIFQLSNRDYDVLWWVIKELCHRGWESLGAAPDVRNEVTSTNFVYQFRRRAADT